MMGRCRRAAASDVDSVGDFGGDGCSLSGCVMARGRVLLRGSPAGIVGGFLESRRGDSRASLCLSAECPASERMRASSVVVKEARDLPLKRDDGVWEPSDGTAEA